MYRFSHRSSKYFLVFSMTLPGSGSVPAGYKLWSTLVLHLRQMGGIVKWAPYTQSTPDSPTTCSPWGQLSNALFSPISNQNISDSTLVLWKFLTYVIVEILNRDCVIQITISTLPINFCVDWIRNQWAKSNRGRKHHWDRKHRGCAKAHGRRGNAQNRSYGV